MKKRNTRYIDERQEERCIKEKEKEKERWMTDGRKQSFFKYAFR
jgi:hypothetical protein